MVSPRRFAAGLEAVAGQESDAGRDPATLQHALVLFAHVDDDGERARNEAIAHLSERYGMKFERHHVEHLCVVGTPEECAARVCAYRDAGAEHISFNPAVGEAEFLEQIAGSAARGDRVPLAAERCPGHLRRAIRRRAVGDPAARRPRRRDHQDRGPGHRGGRRPLCAAVPGRRGFALLRDVQPRQEEHLARSPPSRERGTFSTTSCGCATPCTPTCAATSRASSA